MSSATSRGRQQQQQQQQTITIRAFPSFVSAEVSSKPSLAEAIPALSGIPDLLVEFIPPLPNK
ncbi:hypothetical protein OnM2_044086 [Erysiphe neolycopersici]|uniref:Uncharacterized protein n=1 Tax=Erysiphe neolycopersici TaxID=212602 RepID=A0A420HUW2_9PEZI|nr:hypothetical protein OnM2_044086 [Erysiphe neolycopersici]